MLGEDVAVAGVHQEIAKLVLGLTGARAAHPSAESEVHKADQDR